MLAQHQASATGITRRCTGRAMLAEHQAPATGWAMLAEHHVGRLRAWIDAPCLASRVDPGVLTPLLMLAQHQASATSITTRC